jgi:Holliday junction resolvase-like predicted endonuclease
LNQQTKLKSYWQKQGYLVINLIRVSPIGMPDLIALKPDEVVFIESKEVGDRLSPLQKVWLNKLTKIGFKCYVNFELWSL